MTNLRTVTKSSDDETMQRIARYIESAPENSRIFTINPVIAKWMLETYNDPRNNRSKKPEKITLYAGHMAGETWRLTGDTIKFSDAKILRDGQNRLMACVRSGSPFATHVVFGIEDNAFAAMDQGKNRDGSDVLKIAGYVNTRALAAAVRWAWMIDEGRVKLRDTLQPDKTLRLMRERYHDLPDFMPVAMSICKDTGQPIGVVAAFLHAFSRKGADRAREFAVAWNSGNHSGEFGSLGKLQKEIARLAASSSGRVHDVVRAALIVGAWNAFVAGRRGNKTDFTWSPSDDFPVIGG